MLNLLEELGMEGFRMQPLESLPSSVPNRKSLFHSYKQFNHKYLQICARLKSISIFLTI
jgi:hypothetical protein